MQKSTKVYGMVIALSLGLLAACGGQSESTPVADQPTQAAAKPTPVASPTPAPAPAQIPTPIPQTLTPTPQSPSLPNVRAGLIVYTNDDGEILTVKPDGSGPSKVSPDDGFFTWPFWSPDGTQIAFSGSSPTAEDSGVLALYAYHLADKRLSVVYTNQPGTGPIVVGLPHYPFWAPDGGRLAFFANEPQGLTLLVTGRRVGDGAGVVLRNAPLYASWSADSGSLLVHGGLDHFLVEVEEGFAPTDLGIRSAGYRAPAWWPLGDRIVFVSAEATGTESLYMAYDDREDWTLLDVVDGEAAFAWSPDGRLLAVAKSQFAGGIVYQGIAFYYETGVKQPMEIDDDVVAFFWSPDSKRLAYAALTETRGVLSWVVLNLEEDVGRPLVDFIPSGAQSTMFQFFDQFAYSQSPWSPDSGSLVFAGDLADDAVSASLGRQTPARVFVVDVGPNPQAEPIAQGFIASWSPR